MLCWVGGLVCSSVSSCREDVAVGMVVIVLAVAVSYNCVTLTALLVAYSLTWYSLTRYSFVFHLFSAGVRLRLVMSCRDGDTDAFMVVRDCAE